MAVKTTLFALFLLSLALSCAAYRMTPGYGQGGRGGGGFRWGQGGWGQFGGHPGSRIGALAARMLGNNVADASGTVTGDVNATGVVLLAVYNYSGDYNIRYGAALKLTDAGLPTSITINDNATSAVVLDFGASATWTNLTWSGNCSALNANVSIWGTWHASTGCNSPLRTPSVPLPLFPLLPPFHPQHTKVNFFCPTPFSPHLRSSPTPLAAPLLSNPSSAYTDRQDKREMEKLAAAEPVGYLAYTDWQDKREIEKLAAAEPVKRPTATSEIRAAMKSPPRATPKGFGKKSEKEIAEESDA
ncbi:unnamed protein product [Closterium sp. Naga37s-1]|nr:unnamed protein product [Closterium sp. Naga37s-1]